MLINRVMLIPFYSWYMGFDNIIGLVRLIFPAVTQDSFYFYYIVCAVLPFNLLRGLVCALVTFALYKQLEKLFDRMFPAARKAESSKEADADDGRSDASAVSNEKNV